MDKGVPASPSGYSAEPEPEVVSAADAVSIPNAEVALQTLLNDDAAMTALAKDGPLGFTVMWGYRAPQIHAQIKAQGLPYWSPALHQCSHDADELIDLKERGILSQRELDRARTKLFAKAFDAVRDHAAAIIAHRPRVSRYPPEGPRREARLGAEHG